MSPAPRLNGQRRPGVSATANPHTVNPTRSYKADDDQWRETDSLGQDDLLPMAEVLREAYAWIKAQKRADAKAGREQAGRRPAVVLSPRGYNEKTSLAVVCPVTSHAKGYPFEVAVPPGMEIKGVILSDHLKNLDWRQRRAQRAGRISQAVLEQVQNRIAALLQVF